MDKGKLIEEYKASKMMWVTYGIFIGFMLLLMLAGISMKFVFPRDNDMNIVAWFSVIFCGSIAAIFYFIAKKRMNIPAYQLYENGIEKTFKGETYFMPAAQLSDVYMFRTGKSLAVNNLAFRCEGRSQWELLSNHHGGDKTTFIDTYLPARFSYLMNKINAGEKITFNYTSAASAVAKSFTALSAKSFFNIKTSTIELSSANISFNGFTYSLADLKPIQSGMLQSYNIADKKGKELFSFYYTNMWSCDVFVELYDKLVNQNNTMGIAH